MIFSSSSKDNTFCYYKSYLIVPMFPGEFQQAPWSSDTWNVYIPFYQWLLNVRFWNCFGTNSTTHLDCWNFCNGLHLLQITFHWWGMGLHLSLHVRTNMYLIVSYNDGTTTGTLNIMRLNNNFPQSIIRWFVTQEQIAIPQKRHINNTIQTEQVVSMYLGKSICLHIHICM